MSTGESKEDSAVAQGTDTDLSQNPLLAHGELPRFEDVEASHVAPAIRHLLGQLGEELEELEQRLSSSSEGLIESLERMGDRLGFAWGVVGHLMGVKNSDELREAHESVQTEVVEFGLRQSQSRPIYDALMTAVAKLGSDAEIAPKKAYVSLRRNKQFALIQPSTATRVDVGINLKGVKATARLEASGSFNRFSSTGTL